MQNNPHQLSFFLPDAYFAGFFDADGTVGITRIPTKSGFVLQVQVGQVDRSPLLLFQERWYGSIIGPVNRQDPRHRPIYVWRVESKLAERFLLDIFPYVIVKRERVLYALKFRELFRGANIIPRGLLLQKIEHQAKRKRILDAREVAYQHMARLNKKGV